MRRSFTLFIILLAIPFIAGCASLGELAQGIQEVDATTEIAAVSTLIDDIVNQPWDNIATVGLGYGLALLRRWYKKKKGAK